MIFLFQVWMMLRKKWFGNRKCLLKSVLLVLCVYKNKQFELLTQKFPSGNSTASKVCNYFQKGKSRSKKSRARSSLTIQTVEKRTRRRWGLLLLFKTNWVGSDGLLCVCLILIDLFNSSVWVCFLLCCRKWSAAKCQPTRKANI